MDYLTTIILIMLLALVIWLAFFIWVSRFRSSHVKVFIIGGLGWTAAYALKSFATIPVHLFLSSVLVVVVAALLVGFFEESLRFVLGKRLNLISRTNGEIVSFGIGWGVFEILILHTRRWISYLSDILVPDLFQPAPIEFFMLGLVGSFERNLAVALHIGFTVMIVKALQDRRLLLPAMVLHVLIDLVVGLSAPFLLVTIQGVLVLELIVVVFIVGFYIALNKLLNINLKGLFFEKDAQFYS